MNRKQLVIDYYLNYKGYISHKAVGAHFGITRPAVSKILKGIKKKQKTHEDWAIEYHTRKHLRKIFIMFAQINNHLPSSQRLNISLKLPRK